MYCVSFTTSLKCLCLVWFRFGNYSKISKPFNTGGVTTKGGVTFQDFFTKVLLLALYEHVIQNTKRLK